MEQMSANNRDIKSIGPDLHFRTISQNVRGLNDQMKRKVVFERMKDKAEVMFLQETYSTNNVERYWGQFMGWFNDF